ncbi:dTDP-4-dehydrorhamnose 3,5-epimerase family protein [Actinokineospora bangkokensis]|uniref:dTDP-4-dehydrorhamnose 3,5-epimerase n=1 Tax=Actinokineospora bangkokensis TaxID=1193682 RepID=A0A1Q9LED5_9PSEU|nr:dTDP-4-dehydrorhamnose 3,5-epimerase [Actinokineospora bangkokensis]OLR90386.1 dTDP-4-dehydrorhamnose 3,5-epimerase [Actinokineospora bangkokensis]
MQARQLAVPGAFEFTPRSFPDDRGVFASPFQAEAFREAVGFGLTLAQTNHSLSRRGVVRGLHFADVPPGQAKYIYCAAGSAIDFVVDIRVGSPTFGAWDTVRIDPEGFRGVYVPEGVGHGFVALEDATVVNYLCSTGYNPGAEHGINPLDPELGLPWPTGVEPILSEKDAKAPSLAEALATGLLPRYEDCLARYAELKSS